MKPNIKVWHSISGLNKETLKCLLCLEKYDSCLSPVLSYQIGRIFDKIYCFALVKKFHILREMRVLELMHWLKTANNSTAKYSFKIIANCALYQ